MKSYGMSPLLRGWICEKLIDCTGGMCLTARPRCAGNLCMYTCDRKDIHELKTHSQKTTKEQQRIEQANQINGIQLGDNKSTLLIFGFHNDMSHS